MYRAQSDAEYPMQNVNAANLAGVMWYLHNEIVESTPRKYGVTRVLRLKVTMMNTAELWFAHQAQFGPFVAFDQARCTVPNCANIWYELGYVVGCQATQIEVANYTAAYQTAKHCVGLQCNSPIWYSLPGACPDLYLTDKTQACMAMEPGGYCFSSYDTSVGLGDPDTWRTNSTAKDWQVTGARDCTYHVEHAGEVRLDELTIPGWNYSDFTAAGYQEYDKDTDRGFGTTFWNGVHNGTAGHERMERLRYLFYTKVGSTKDFPYDLPEAMCDR